MSINAKIEERSGGDFWLVWDKAAVADIEALYFTTPSGESRTLRPSVGEAHLGKSMPAKFDVFVTPADILMRPQEKATWPAAPPPPPPLPVAFQVGVGADGSQTAVDLTASIGAKVARVEFGMSRPAGDLDDILNRFASKGVRVQPLAGFGNQLPSTATARNVGNWAQRHGPNGTKRITLIEFGNETSYGHNFPGSPAHAGDYARRLADAHDACKGTGVGLLGQIDDGARGDGWPDGMFNAVPDLPSKVAGWVVHPYHLNAGPPKILRAIDALKRHGDTTTPFYLTEWGISIDEGYTLVDENYEYPPNMTYKEGADAVQKAFDKWNQMLGKRLAQVLVFQYADMRGHGQEGPHREHHFGIFGCPWAGGGTKGAYTEKIRQLVAAST